MIGRTAICCLLCSLNFGIQAQYNNFNYKNEYDKVNIYDAYARTSLGVRL